MTINGKVLSGCGTITTKEMPSQLGINSEMDIHTEDLYDYVENDCGVLIRPQVKYIFSALHPKAMHMTMWANGKMIKRLSLVGKDVTRKRIWKKK